MKDFSLENLGTLVHIFMSGGYADTAQIYLNEMQERVAAAKASHKQGETHAEVTAAVLKNEPQSLLPRDDKGNVTRISTQVGDSGYDSEVHENLELKIFCDGTHFPTAHTADTVMGTVWYYEKNAQGRIKTLSVDGKVEIRGL